MESLPATLPHSSAQQAAGICGTRVTVSLAVRNDSGLQLPMGPAQEPVGMAESDFCGEGKHHPLMKGMGKGVG